MNFKIIKTNSADSQTYQDQEVLIPTNQTEKIQQKRQKNTDSWIQILNKEVKIKIFKT